MKFVNRAFLKSSKAICFIMATMLMLLYIVLWWQEVPHDLENKNLNSTDGATVMTWWRTSERDHDYFRYCGSNKCMITTNQSNLSAIQAILFYASEFEIRNMPLPRLPHHIWALLHEESPRNTPLLLHGSILEHFNLTSTFSRYSDLPLTTSNLANVKQLTSMEYVVPIKEKNILRINESLAPIAFLQSNCDTMSGRDEYVNELMQYIHIDCYGRCLHNRDMPINLSVNYLLTLNSAELYKFLARYKFIMSYENGICHDYITEKYWRPLIIGSIPIYFGSPSIREWEPNKKSAIYIAEFSSPKDLAKFINDLDGNDTEYNTYLSHKYNKLNPISNLRLLEELAMRKYSDGSSQLNFFAMFEQFVCCWLHNVTRENVKMASLQHYNCPLPPLFPQMKIMDYSNLTVNNWFKIIDIGMVEAQALNSLLWDNKNYSDSELWRTLSLFYEKLHLRTNSH